MLISLRPLAPTLPLMLLLLALLLSPPLTSSCSPLLSASTPPDTLLAVAGPAAAAALFTGAPTPLVVTSLSSVLVLGWKVVRNWEPKAAREDSTCACRAHTQVGAS